MTIDEIVIARHDLQYERAYRMVWGRGNAKRLCPPGVFLFAKALRDCAKIGLKTWVRCYVR